MQAGVGRTAGFSTGSRWGQPAPGSVRRTKRRTKENAMTELAARQCVPCRRDTPPLRSEEVQSMMQQVPGWTTTQDGKLTRNIKLTDFKAALALVNQIGDLVDQRQRRFKIGELDVARQLAILRGCPAWHLLHHGLYLLTAQRWRIAPTRYALPGSQLCHCVLLSAPLSAPHT